jgi:uncharacterized protein YciI
MTRVLFLITARDKPDSHALRDSTRPPHAAYLERQQHRLVTAGSVLDAQGRAVGSTLIVTADSLADAERFAANDPFALAGLFATQTVAAFRMAFKDGARVPR